MQKEGDRASSYSADRSFFDNSLVEWNLDGPGPRSSGVESRSHLPWHRARSSRCWRTGRAGFVFRPLFRSEHATRQSLARTWSSYAPRRSPTLRSENHDGRVVELHNLLECLKSAKAAHAMFPGHRPYRIEQRTSPNDRIGRWWGASCCPIRHQRPPLSHGERFSKSASNSARLEKFDTDVMVSSPNDPARPTRVRRSGQMQSKAFRQIVNVANRQACT